MDKPGNPESPDDFLELINDMTPKELYDHLAEIDDDELFPEIFDLLIALCYPLDPEADFDGLVFKPTNDVWNREWQKPVVRSVCKCSLLVQIQRFIDIRSEIDQYPLTNRDLKEFLRVIFELD